MPRNYVEELVSEYYKIHGYFVMNNYWFPFTSERKRTVKGKKQKFKAQSWTDLDVVAINAEELILIQTKAIINTKDVANNIITFFGRVDKFLQDGKAPDQKSDISWWKHKRKIRKLVVYESCIPSYNYIVEKAGIETVDFKKILEDIVNYIKIKKGEKEENPTMRLLTYLSRKKIVKI